MDDYKYVFPFRTSPNKWVEVIEMITEINDKASEGPFPIFPLGGPDMKFTTHQKPVDSRSTGSGWNYEEYLEKDEVDSGSSSVIV